MTIVASAYVLAAALATGPAGAPSSVDPEEAACLALNVYYEARGESRKGQEAVAHVTLNRARSSRYPESICAVVTQRHKSTCQFSWYCDNGLGLPRDAAAFDRALGVAADVLAGRAADPTKGATYFVSTRIDRPDWTRRLEHTATIDGHHFYRR